MKYKLSEIAIICGGYLEGADLTVRGVETDSRNGVLGRDTLFVAMRGANHDSHDFIPQMVNRGVQAFLTERPVELPEGCGAVVVANAISALQSLAAHYRNGFSGCVVAVTGSNGKTIVKEWIAQAVSRYKRVFRSPRSYNSQIGVALSLLMAEGDEDIVLIEAGISRCGEMSRLQRMIRPEVVIFTSVGDAHQENFSSLEEKIVEKLMLAREARVLIINDENELLRRVAENLSTGVKIYYATSASSHYAKAVPSPKPAEGVSASNARLVTAFCRVMNLPDPDLRYLPPVAMRLEVKEGINGSLIVDDAYNSDINSLTIALDYLHSVAAGRPETLILSDIEQSCIDETEFYGRVASLVASSGVERMIGIGSRISANAGSFSDIDCEFYGSTDDFLHRMKRSDFAGRAILLKGSRSSRFERIGSVLQKSVHTTMLEVDLDAMVHNLNYYRSKLPSSQRLTAMVKASGYGAGDAELAYILQHHGVNYLAVAFADEGILLRERGVSMPVLVLNADAGSFDRMVLNRLEPEIYNFASLEAFVESVARYGERRYPIHVKLDTGMHRLGFIDEEIDILVQRLHRYSEYIEVATIFAHLSCADDPLQDDFTRLQIGRFDSMSSRIASSLPYPVVRHTANTAAIERFPEARFDMCRLGIGLYGYGSEHNPSLRPVSTLRTRIVQLRRRAAGEGIGYGRSQILSRDSLIATIPVGYADGLDRHLGCGAWSMLVGGSPAPVVGRICMDSCMIDVTDVPDVKEGDEVCVFSPAGGNTAEDMARVLGTIPYEILTSVSSRVKRIYIKE